MGMRVEVARHPSNIVVFDLIYFCGQYAVHPLQKRRVFDKWQSIDP
jgi:hypothetical protein